LHERRLAYATISTGENHLRLYYSPGACSLAPHIVAREAGISIELVKVDLAAKRTEGGEDFLAVNPKGSIPALVLSDGTILTEGAVISQFIADQSPNAGLLPAHGTIGRYRTLEWLNFIATELHKGFGPLWRKETPDEMRIAIKNMLGTKVSFLDRHLAGQDFLTADGFGVADAYAFTVLSWAPVVGIDLSSWPNVASYVDGISARPNVRAALAAEGLGATKCN
jgi:glutathione S-transferase